MSRSAHRALAIVVGWTLIVATTGMRASAPPAPQGSFPPIVVEGLDHTAAIEEVANIYFGETLYATGNPAAAFEAASAIIGLIKAHFYSGSPNTLTVHFPPLPPPQSSTQEGDSGSSAPEASSEIGDRNAASEDEADKAPPPKAGQDSGDGLASGSSSECAHPDWGLADDGSFLSISEAFNDQNPDTGTSRSGGSYQFLGLTGGWESSFTPNDPFDPGQGGWSTTTIHPDELNCLDFGGEFGISYDSYDYGDGGPGSSGLMVGWSWSL